MTQNRNGLPVSIIGSKRFFEMHGAGKSSTPAGWNTPANWKTLGEIPEDRNFGFVVCDQKSTLAFIDGDHIIRDGVMIPEAQQVFDRIAQIGDTYKELSLSESGQHMIVDLGECADSFEPVTNGANDVILWMDPKEYSELPKVERKKVPKIEIFYRTAGRYVYLTGNNAQVVEVAKDETAAAMFRELLRIRDECHMQYAKPEPETDSSRTELKEDADTLEAALEALQYISAADYQVWQQVGQACKNIGLPFEAWDEWSQYTDMRTGDLYPNYDAKLTEYKWKSFRGAQKYGVGTIFFYAKKNGYVVPKSVGLGRFHLHDKNGRITGVFDWAIFDYLRQKHDILVCGGTPYIYQDGAFRPDLSGSRLKTMIRELILPQYIKSTTVDRVYRLFISAEELQVAPDGFNQYPEHWICFLNGFYDPVARVMVPHDPKYRAVNQLPHMYDPYARPEGKTVKRWLSSIAEPDDLEMLLQFAGYCMTRDTRQQKFMILRGTGGTGKSTLIRMIEAVIGAENLSNISLSQLSQRFAAFGLMGKLVNSCADLEVTALEDTTVLKRALGEDRISAEQKGKDQISFSNYAKLIFSTNELPVVKSEKTNGFYRRLLVLTMDRIPDGARPDFFAELRADLDAFIHMCVEALERMHMIGYIRESQGSKEAVEQLRNDSDTVAAFLADCCTADLDGTVPRSAAFAVYRSYCLSAERTPLSRNNFYRSMRLKRIGETKVSGERSFRGISLQKSAPNLPPNLPRNDWGRVPDGTTPF